MSVDKKEIEELHWLVRADTIRKLWLGGCAVLGVLVLAELFVDPHPYFGIDGKFGFNAWYGFATCAAMVIGAKALSLLLKRADTYYDTTDKGSETDNV
ncbi:MAG: hypothetical protein ISR45_08560 [Rhodospirillales bacterium]|nr:hypothetical protein [Rhodospirillales bacterium]